MRGGATAAPTPAPHPLPTASHTPPVVRVAAGGTITGRVYDYTYGQPILGATIRITPFSAATCLPSACFTNVSGTNGVFSVPAPTGPDTVQVTAPDYVGNQTWTVVGDGATVNLGFVFLLHDGWATGIVEDATPDHAPIGNVTINATSRNGLITTGPEVVTGANGSFTVAVPPLPSQLSFLPPGDPSPYFENFTWTNVTAYHTVDLGIVHLEGGVPVSATFYDRLTGQPIPTGDPSQLTVCTRRANLCASPYLNETGPGPLPGWALPGAASVTAFAVGYVVNTSAVPDIPNTNRTFSLGRIYLLPLAAVELSTNLTGGPPPGGGWPAGNVTAFVCSLDGLSVAVQRTPGGKLLATPCWPRGLTNLTAGNTYPVGATTIAYGPPLRDAVFVVPASAEPPTFPIPTTESFSPTPLFPTTYANVTWVNLTPDQVTVAGSVDVATGTYLQGNVSLLGWNGSEEGTFSVQVCSTDVTAVCGAPVLSSDLEPAVVGCASGPASFCVPAPPGPDRLTLTELGPMTTNYTWVEVPSGCCAQSGHPTEIGWVNISVVDPYGSLNGSAVAQVGGYGSARAPPGGLFGTVSACPVIPPLPGQPITACTYGSLDPTTGAFNLTAPIGWDQVTVQAYDFQSNWSWIDETGANSTGTIQLAPDGFFTGRVLTEGGVGIPGAIVEACPVGAPNQCLTVGSAGTDGEYNGTIAAPVYIGSAYEVQASYPGYTTEWTWTNATANDVVRVPKISLPPIPEGANARGGGVSPAALSTVTWVQGRIVDSRTGLAVPNADLSQCQNFSCFGSLGQTTVGGTFNVSLDTANTSLFVTAGDYTAGTFAVALSTGPVEELGSLNLTPDPWYTGQVTIGPWGSLATSDGLGVPAEVQVCVYLVGDDCALAAVTNTAGFYNVSGPNGSVEMLTQGEAAAAFGSALGGFYPQTVKGNVTPNGTFFGPNGTLPLQIYGSLSGLVHDLSDANGSAPAPFVTVSADTLVPYLSGFLAGSSVVATGPSGAYTLFLPPGGPSIYVSAVGSSFLAGNETVNGSMPTPGSAVAPTFNVTHYGWVTATVVNAANQAPLGFAAIATVTSNPFNGTALDSASVANGAGVVNVSVAPGHNVSVLLSAPGFLPKSSTVVVTASATKALGTIGLTVGAPPIGFVVRSPSINALDAPTVDAVDPATGAPLADASVVAISPVDGSEISTIVRTNALGQFFLWVTGTYPAIDLDLKQPSYDPLTLYVPTPTSGTQVVPHLNTTGASVVAGKVVAEPNGTGVYDLGVLVCQYGNPTCDTSTEGFTFTNGSGDFWVAAPRGFDQVTVISQDYLTNVTPSVTVPADGFVKIGNVPVYAFADLSGTVLGVPYGTHLVGANVSLCSIFGNPYGPCGLSTNTTAGGNFTLPAPPSTYVLVVRAPGYNETYEPVALPPGDHLQLGAILLIADGNITGRAVSVVNGAAAPNATAIACASYAAGDCSTLTNASSNGSFTLLAPPGLDLVRVSSPQFFDNYSSVDVPAGGGITVPAAVLTPFAVDIPESLSGTVVASNASGGPIPGAVVALTQGTVTIVSGVTRADGGFTLNSQWGTYDLVVSAPGFTAARIALTLHTNVTGVRVALTTMTYRLHGTVTDSATHAGLADVAIEQNGTTLVATGGSGTYSVQLPNGTYDLVAVAPNGSSGAYAPLPFTVRVSGGDQVRNLSLTPTVAVLTGTVVDADSGLPIAGATIVVQSTSGAIVGRATSGLTGEFSLALAPGTYTLNVTASGHDPATLQVSVPNPGGPVAIPLTPSLQPSFATSGLPSTELVVLAVVGAVVLIGVFLLLRRRPPAEPPPERPRWVLDTEETDTPPATEADEATPLAPNPGGWTLEDLEEPGVEDTTGPGR